MLGSNTGYLNVDSFDQVQFDLQNPDLVVGEGDILDIIIILKPMY